MSQQQLSDVDHFQREELVHALQERTAQLETLRKEFDQFSHSVSHDLRAPLRALEGFADILVEDYGQQLDPEARRCLEIIATSSRKASLLIEDLLVISRLAKQELKPAVINMEESVKGVISNLAPHAGGTEFNLGELPEAWGDRALLDQVWHHLLGNAVKFAGALKKPLIEIGGRTEAGHNVYYVKDNGVGFDMKYVGRLFGVFQRLHSEQDYEGRGIGLALVQRIIHRHGGEVWAEASPGQGACFFFSLPHKPDHLDFQSLEFPGDL